MINDYTKVPLFFSFLAEIEKDYVPQYFGKSLIHQSDQYALRENIYPLSKEEVYSLHLKSKVITEEIEDIYEFFEGK
ncbi:hypothetical protein [Chryseobacterium indologenes]|uniref:Uncharacterized protein n=1 Tax=Chryseobacterium indologenes TaxID=253 RepID=A0A0N0ITU2_CHRID|nr:hypothetical protein [Chryseobacterium indologenes]KPE49071.1 hypothetical protein AOB46_21990 [Chryseobacterium indologenes]